MKRKQPEISVVRAYEIGDEDHSYRVLVDRLWPRGIRKDRLRLDEWLKDVAPSTELRRWFDHRPERWREFQARYKEELVSNPDGVGRLLSVAADRPLVLVYGARDEKHNHAIVLRDVLVRKLRTPKKKMTDI